MLAGIGPVCAHQPGAGLAAPAGFYSPHPALQRQGLHRVLERLPLVPHTRTGQGPRGRVLRRILRLGQHVHSRRRLHHHCRPGSALGDRVDGRALNRSPGSFVVVATTTTQECRRCHNDDKHVREVVVPPATLATGITTATQYQPEPDDDHGTTAGGGAGVPWSCVVAGVGRASPGPGTWGGRDVQRPGPVGPAPRGTSPAGALRRAGGQLRGEDHGQRGGLLVRGQPPDHTQQRLRLGHESCPTANSRRTRAQNASRSHSRASW
jgi:hypothetical protein